MKMIQRQLIEEATKTAERAATTTGGIRQQASEKADEMRARATEAATAAKEQIRDQAAGAAEAGLSGVEALVEEFSTALPVLREAGFTVCGIQIKVGLPPRLIADFSCSGNLSETAADALAAQYEDRRLAVVLMRSLRQAQKLQSSVRLAGLQPAGLSVEIGLAPLVVIKLA